MHMARLVAICAQRPPLRQGLGKQRFERDGIGAAVDMDGLVTFGLITSSQKRPP